MVVERARKGTNAVKVMARAGFQQRTLYLLKYALVIAALEFGLVLLTLSANQIIKLERIQKETMRTVMECTQDNPVTCMRYILALPSIR
jgi:hypothetical protein